MSLVYCFFCFKKLPQAHRFFRFSDRIFMNGKFARKLSFPLLKVHLQHFASGMMEIHKKDNQFPGQGTQSVICCFRHRRSSMMCQ